MYEHIFILLKSSYFLRSNKLKLIDVCSTRLLQNSKVGKIRTESGAWIPATYKTNRYNQWKEKTKVGETNDDDDDDDESHQQTQKCKFADLMGFYPSISDYSLLLHKTNQQTQTAGEKKQRNCLWSVRFIYFYQILNYYFVDRVQLI